MSRTRRQVLELAAGVAVATSGWRFDRDRSIPPWERFSRESSPTGSDAFDPAVHGFGFPNWEGDTGTDVEGEEFTYEPRDVTLDDVRRAIDDSWTTVFSEAQEAIMTRIVYSWVGSAAATNGHCYGMAFAADYYSRNPEDLPAGLHAASEVPRPTGQYSTVGDRIRRLQTSQLLRLEPYWFAHFGLTWGLADHQESLRQLTATLDGDGTTGLMLTGEAGTHQVLAHEYEHRGDVVAVSVYDPTYGAADYRNSDDPWTLVVDPETGDVDEIEDGYEEFLHHDPDMDLSVVDALIGSRDRVLDKLADAVFLGLETGDALELDVPADVLVDRPAAKYASLDRIKYADVAVVFGPIDEFEISIAGEEDGKFLLETLGIRDGDLISEETVSGTIAEVPARLRVATDETGEFVVDVIEDVEQGAAEAATEVEEIVAETGETGDGDATDGRDWIEDNWWIAAIGGALGLGAGYGLLAHRSDGED